MKQFQQKQPSAGIRELTSKKPADYAPPSLKMQRSLDDDFEEDLNIKIDDDFDGRTQSDRSWEECEEEYYEEEEVQNEVLFDNFEKAFDNMMEEQDDIQDAEDLNQRFLAQ